MTRGKVAWLEKVTEQCSRAGILTHGLPHSLNLNEMTLKFCAFGKPEENLNTLLRLKAFTYLEVCLDSQTEAD